MQEPSSGSQSHCLAKITNTVPLCLSIWTLSVLWRHIPTCCSRAGRKVHSTLLHGEPHTHAQQFGICHHDTDSAHIDKHNGTIFVILARHWVWLRDDGSCV